MGKRGVREGKTVGKGKGEDEKKKVPARVPFVWQISAIEPKMAVLPDRSGPVSHKILMG